MPSFGKSSFDLQVPKLDPSMARRLKEVRGGEATKAEAKEKSLVALQFKILDIAKPLLYLWGSATSEATPDAAGNVPLLVSASESALQLWGHAFHSITIQRRENVLRQTDPRFESLLAETSRFKPREYGLLFVRTFLKNKVRDASDDQKLKSLGQPGGRPFTSAASGRSSKTSSSARSQKSRRSRSGFTLTNFNKRGFKPGFSNRGSRLVSELLHVLPVSESSQVIVGGRVSKCVSFWPSLTADFWILEAISLGVRIPFINAPFQSRPSANMSFNSEMRAICDAEVKSLLLKRAIENIPMEDKCFVSGIFVISKSSGGFRPIVNLKGLNRFVDHYHF